MGLIGLLVTVGLLVLGASYFFFAGQKSSMTVTNDSSMSVTEGVSRYEDVKQQALDVKNIVEQQANDTSQQITDNSQQKTTNSELAHTPPLAESVSGRQSGAGELKIENRLMNSGFTEKKSRSIDTIVLHSSYDLLGQDPYSVEGVVKEYEMYGVSAHYLINRKGIIYRLVADNNIAYHAGVSKMPDGRTDVNEFSIGIEMMNTETGQFSKAQYAAVNDLIAYLKTRHPITSVVGHSDIAPGRKTDPWNFDWKKLRD